MRRIALSLLVALLTALAAPGVAHADGSDPLPLPLPDGAGPPHCC